MARGALRFLTPRPQRGSSAHPTHQAPHPPCSSGSNSDETCPFAPQDEAQPGGGPCNRVRAAQHPCLLHCTQTSCSKLLSTPRERYTCLATVTILSKTFQEHCSQTYIDKSHSPRKRIVLPPALGLQGHLQVCPCPSPACELRCFVGTLVCHLLCCL